ncbi:MAG: tetratricopeptide repeat protein [Gemmatimonadaceae bacterium]|nr:tetratricopeptide repeat protein [Gemmatimonadaceae bacterium]
MTAPRLDALRAMVARSPGNALARFGLANELLKAGLWEEAAVELRAYLAAHDDEGNAYGRLAEACVALGRNDEAREALRQGIAAAQRFGHPGMAHDLAGRLEDLEDSA